MDYTPQLFDTVVGVNIIETMILAALGKKTGGITDDDYLEIITSLGIEPRIFTPPVSVVSRFAFVIHPLSQKYLANAKPLDAVSRSLRPW